MRKAVTTKRTKSRIPENVPVLIKEVHIKGNNYRYEAQLDANEPFLPISPSEFEFLEDEEFVVSVERKTSSVENIKVKAKTRKEAEEQAVEKAANTEFSSTDADYSVIATSQL